MKSPLRLVSSMSLVAILLSVIFSVGPGSSQAQAQGFCDAAQFITDVTVPDGTTFNFGATFNKTWRLKNVGTCTWTTAYSMVFVSGDLLGAPTSVPMPQTVAPGQTVDITVPMVAANTPGTFTGFWEFKNASGQLFGIGSGFTHTWWVKIVVTAPQQLINAFDFADNFCNGRWFYDGGPIGCPANQNKLNFGYVIRLDNPIMETGQPAGAPGLLTVPQDKFNGAIHGAFIVPTISRGDHFQATIGCQFNAVNCSVTFELDYLSQGQLVTIWKFREKYDGQVFQADVDLTRFASMRNIQLVLTVTAVGGNAASDAAVWVDPRIVRFISGSAVPPATPPGIISTSTPVGVATSTPVPPTSGAGCNRAQFVSDVSIPDGTILQPNVSFTKTWRLQNVGTCTWTTAYSLAFVSGDRMSAPASVLIPQTVVPGQTVDIGINLVSPTVAGEYRGFWELKDTSGNLFGIGSNANSPFWVDIVVSGSTPSATTAFDFAQNVCTAQWVSGAGTLPCPGSAGDARGSVQSVTNPQLENGTTATGLGLLVAPQNVINGYIQGIYPAYAVQNGDRFQATVDCAYGASACFVLFRLDYQVNGGPLQTMWAVGERYDGLFTPVDLDLSSLAGQNVNFILTLLANVDPTGDNAMWVNPKIVHTIASGGAVLPTATSPAPMPTATP